MQRPTPTRARQASQQPTLPTLEQLAGQALVAKRLTAEEAFTLLKIEHLLKAKPDGCFAEMLVAMLQADTDPNHVPTNAEYAQQALAEEIANA